MARVVVLSMVGDCMPAIRVLPLASEASVMVIVPAAPYFGVDVVAIVKPHRIGERGTWLPRAPASFQGGRKCLGQRMLGRSSSHTACTCRPDRLGRTSV